MKKRIIPILALLIALCLTGCGDTREPEASPEAPMQETAAAQPPMEPETMETEEAVGEEESMMQMKIDDTLVTVAWEENDAVEALLALAEEEPLTVRMSMYGGFEQVGSLGQRLPRNDMQITTGAGDIVLYSGNQIVVFYGSNSWAYTRLGHITDKSSAELTELLGNGDVTITIGKDLSA